MIILLFAGTKNGRELAIRLADSGHKVHVSSTSDYGNSLLPTHDGLIGHVGKVDVPQILDMIKLLGIEIIIDATHPYAVEISKNLILADKLVGIPLIRFERETVIPDAIGHHCSTMSAACEYIGKRSGNALFTTGVNDLHHIVRWLDPERLYVRILPIKASLDKAGETVLARDHIIAQKPPFNTQQNLDHIHSYDIRYLVTKDSGKEGNIKEKIEAVDLAGIELVVVDRPDLGYELVCYTNEEVMNLLLEMWI